MNINASTQDKRKWNRPNVFFFVCGSGISRVESPADAATKWEEFRDESNGGCSEIGNGGIVVNQHGEWVCRVAYNGRLFFSRDEMTGYDNFLMKKLHQSKGRELCAS